MDRAPSDTYLINDEIALEFGKLAASRLTEERLAVFRESVHRSILNAGNKSYYQEWLQVLRGGPETIAKALTERTEHGQVMRSVISFRAFVSKTEREQIVRKFSRSRSSPRTPHGSA
jgi:hypothetical protein